MSMTWEEALRPRPPEPLELHEPEPSSPSPEERLAALEAKLPCLSGQHEPLLVTGTDGTLTPLNMRMSVDGVPLLEQRFCKRCRLAYWHEIRIARLEVSR